MQHKNQMCRSLSTRSHIFTTRLWKRTSVDPGVHPTVTKEQPPPLPPIDGNSPYSLHQANVSSSGIRAALPALNRAARKSIERLSGRWDKSTTRLPVWEAICDDLFVPTQRLELKLDFETEYKAPIADHPRPVTARNSMQVPRSSSSSGGCSDEKRPTSRRRILRNIPTLKGGFWNLCFRSAPKIKFIKRFEETS